MARFCLGWSGCAERRARDVDRQRCGCRALGAKFVRDAIPTSSLNPTVRSLSPARSLQPNRRLAARDRLGDVGIVGLAEIADAAMRIVWIDGR